MYKICILLFGNTGKKHARTRIEDERRYFAAARKRSTKQISHLISMLFTCIASLEYKHTISVFFSLFSLVAKQNEQKVVKLLFKEKGVRHTGAHTEKQSKVSKDRINYYLFRWSLIAFFSFEINILNTTQFILCSHTETTTKIIN